jgi:tetratricopeptide (TPR) repeat protein
MGDPRLKRPERLGIGRPSLGLSVLLVTVVLGMLLSTGYAYSEDKHTSKYVGKPSELLDLLNRCEDLARSSSPQTRATAQARLAELYQTVDPSKRMAFLREGFDSALEISEVEDPTSSRERLQLRVLLGLSGSLTETEFKKLLDRADSDVQSEIHARLSTASANEQKFKKALDEFSRAQFGPRFPYISASILLSKLPEGYSIEREQIYSSAISAFRNSDPSESGVSAEDLGTITLRNFASLPRPLVFEALQVLLDRAKSKAANNVSILLSSKDKKAKFDTAYQYRMFQLLPVVEKVDPEWAAKLQKELDEQLPSLTKAFPEGMSSFDRNLLDAKEPPNPDFSMTYLRGSSRGSSSVPSPRAENSVEDLLKLGPEEAVAIAEGLSDGEQKTAALRNLVNVFASEGHTRNLSLAKKSLQDVRLQATKAETLRAAELLQFVGVAYIKLGLFDEAKDTFEEGFDLHSKLGGFESESTPPSLSQSSAILRTFAGLASLLSVEGGMKLCSKLSATDAALLCYLEVATVQSGGHTNDLVYLSKGNKGTGVFPRTDTAPLRSYLVQAPVPRKTAVTHQQ